jgi:hypothetical protein
MNHEILLAKLHFCGSQGVSEEWFRSYLTNRRQKVALTSPNSTQNLFSGRGTLQLGVPQASILGPLLFMIYISDLPLRINSVSEPVLFADDIYIYIYIYHNFNRISTPNTLLVFIFGVADAPVDVLFRLVLLQWPCHKEVSELLLGHSSYRQSTRCLICNIMLRPNVLAVAGHRVARVKTAL